MAASRWLAAWTLVTLGVTSKVPDGRPKAIDVTKPVLREPRVQDYWHFLRNYQEVPLKDFDQQTAPQVLRVSKLDDETFQQLVRDGVPFVVDDCTEGFRDGAISDFECKDFADRWPSGNMRAEYTPGQYHIYLKDPDWYTKVHPQRKNAEHMAGSRKIAGPYIWHVKDEEPLKTKRSVQKHWRTPYFLEKSLANRMEANESFEFWFSLAGGGTFSHVGPKHPGLPLVPAIHVAAATWSSAPAEVQSGAPYSHDLPSFTATVRRVLAALSAADPAGANCLARRVAGRGWYFQFAREPIFVTTFAPCYDEKNPRYQFQQHPESCFILFQPEESFLRHDLPNDKPRSQTNWEHPVDVRDRIRANFLRHGREYRIPETTSYPPAEFIVAPPDVLKDPPVHFWLEGSAPSGR